MAFLMTGAGSGPGVSLLTQAWEPEPGLISGDFTGGFLLPPCPHKPRQEGSSSSECGFRVKFPGLQWCSLAAQ